MTQSQLDKKIKHLVNTELKTQGLNKGFLSDSEYFKMLYKKALEVATENKLRNLS